MSGDSRNSLPGSLLRVGVGLVLVAIGLKWIACVLQSAWIWLAGGLVIVLASAAAVSWWRGRDQW
ncbi:hypothetical protein MANAM107_24340 [Actinomyces capricornis]|uniref:DUF2892 domain-containing protein n=1 Tax=Actinomyces capricornis TaxID=2755559 RepID=A0ABM7UEL0_9ACTO|nr:hypothetical protein MANAM107_24340 [Actinomyces capricornis]